MTSNPLTIRPATSEDGPVLLALIAALAAYEQLPPPDADARARLTADLARTPPRFRAFLASMGNQPVGYAIHFETYSTFLAMPTLYLEDLFVLPEARNQGVGHALFAACAQTALNLGCGRLEWQVLAWNDLAIGFYEHLGAEPLHAAWRCYRLTGEPLRLAATIPSRP